MPLLKNSSELPEWSELDYYEILNLNFSDKYNFKSKSKKEILFLCRGKCEILSDNKMKNLLEGEVLDLAELSSDIIIKSAGDSMIIIVGGKWGEETGTYGIFTLDNSSNPKNIGDPTEYDRTTEFDNHFHDCDEYWVIWKGKGLAVSENSFYDISGGDCIATKAGDHHDFPKVYKTVQGIWFETTLKGQKRKGHLWKHTHGAPGRIL